MIELDGVLSSDDYLMIDSVWKTSATIPEFIIRADIEEIINRPLSYNLIVVPFYLHEPYYVNIKLPKYTRSISDKTWELFNKINLLDHIDIRCKRYSAPYMKKDYIIEPISIESIEQKSTFPHQYCKTCNTIHILSSENVRYQCCADPNLMIIHSINEII